MKENKKDYGVSHMKQRKHENVSRSIKSYSIVINSYQCKVISVHLVGSRMVSKLQKKVLLITGPLSRTQLIRFAREFHKKNTF